MLRSPTLFAAVQTPYASAMQMHTGVANANRYVCICTYASTLINLLL